jgi:hypothetical protein
VRATSSRNNRVLALAAIVLLAGCGGDDLAARPDPAPGATTWVLVGTAALLVAVIVGVLFTWPAWSARRGSRVASLVLGVQAGLLWLAAGTTLASALRIHQLRGRDPEALPVESLIELGEVGDRPFTWLLVVSGVLFLVLPAVVVSVAARFATSERGAERVAAAVVLAVQVGVWAALLARFLVVRDPGWSGWLAVFNLPAVGVALWACWPRWSPGGRRDRHRATTAR